MFKNYFKIALRNILKYKAYSFINIFGLAIGALCCILIFLFIQHELSYDDFHKNKNTIFRVTEKYTLNDETSHVGITQFPVAPTLELDYPQYVKRTARMFNFFSPTLSLRYGDNIFNEPRLFFADSNFFEMFSFSLISGQPDKVLKDINSIVLTESLAKKYFGDENPLGKTIQYEGEVDLLITGLAEDLPGNSQIKFDAIISIGTIKRFFNNGMPTTWYWNPCITFIEMKKADEVKYLHAEMPAFIKKYFPTDFKVEDLSFQPLPDIHLYSVLDSDLFETGDIEFVYILSFVAVLILLIACVNFINLSTARAAKRAREVGMRKVLGAHKKQLIFQFIGESLITCFIAVLIASVISQFVIPSLNSFAEINIDLNIFSNLELVGALFGLLVFVGILGGIYPAFFLASFKPASVLKGKILSGHKKIGLRQVLVVFQFLISIIMISSTAIVFEQINFLRDKKLGFNKDEIIVIPIYRTKMLQNFDTYKNFLLQNPNIKNITVGENVIGTGLNLGVYRVEGKEQPEPFSRILAREDLIETYDLKLIAGRSFTKENPADLKGSIIVNEYFVKSMNWKNPSDALGKSIYWGANDVNKRSIVGVVKDFNYESLHTKQGPFIYFPDSVSIFGNRFISAKVNMANVTETIKFMEEKWKELVTSSSFEYKFLNEEINNLYKTDKKLGDVIGIFSVLAIIVASLGLLGLVSFAAEQKTKEIGIRKVLGATVPGLINLQLKEYFKLIIVANIIALPAAYYLMDSWLSDFAYRINIGIVPFMYAMIFSIFVAVTTVWYQANKAATSNPIKSIRYE
ncbi:MAG: hypothetical protein A2068_12680 [Ignavibacteria bacterium GWB2_35_6b]|nr:MAG: hypothetical protein A2068_12680 [Ignavibacteria bacterium GWB2_35_6b]